MDPKEDHEASEISKPTNDATRKRSSSSPTKDVASPSKRAKHQSSDVSQSAEEKKLPVKPESIPLSGGSDGLTDSKPSASGSLSRVMEEKIKSDDVFVEDAKEKMISFGVKTERKKGRLRKKAVMKSVLDQMEFYFSDCNLSKDRYLRQIYDQSEDGFVDLAIFGNFNKLQSLHKDGVSLSLLRKALQKSTFLELNEAGTKVRRCTPLVELDQEETDKRTVYVEYLPRHANHAWLQKMFSQCGKVCYVSLPTFRTTKQPKGFAFVEFQSSEEALKACEVFNNPPPARIDEKPGKFPKGNKTLNRLNRILPAKSEEEENEENTNTDEKEDQDNSSSSNKKKKKKKTKKRRASDGATEESCEKKESKQVTAAGQEGKKTKKKKKKKQGVSSDSAITSEEESSSKAGKAPTDNLEDKEKKPSDSSLNNENPSDGSLIKKDTECEGVAGADKECKKVTEEMEENSKESEESSSKKRKKRKKRKKSDLDATDKNISQEKSDKDVHNMKSVEPKLTSGKDQMEVEKVSSTPILVNTLLSRKERKRLRQEDIQRKKMARQEDKSSNDSSSEKVPKGIEPSNPVPKPNVLKRKHESDVSEGSEVEQPAKVRRKSDGSELMSCLVKSKKQAVQKKVEFNPVPITKEFIKQKEVRRRKKVKRDSLHLRVITKNEWLALKSEFIDKQKAHMSALKKSLRELRQQEDRNRIPEEPKGQKHVDLTDVFGTKRLKPTLDIKLAHIEKLKFRPNVIVQWKCSHELPRQKIRAMFNEISGEHIDYIEAQEEAKSGYIRFKDEKSAETFAKVSRFSPSFSARILPESQQAAYWEKANRDRIAKLSRKRCERGSERIARKVFERNKATFHQKPSHIVFDEDDKKEENGTNKIISDGDKEKQPADDNGEKDQSIPVQQS